MRLWIINMPGWSIATIMLCLLLAVPATAATGTQPNILGILADDMGWGDAHP